MIPVTLVFRFYGYDNAGVPRVWGEGQTRDIAETRCLDAAKEYICGRPDTGPFSQWTVIGWRGNQCV